MEKYGEIKVLSAERDDPGNSWVITAQTSFWRVGILRSEVRVRMSERHDDEQKISMAEATDEAVKRIVEDTLLLARQEADRLTDAWKSRLITAFPRKPGTAHDDHVERDGKEPSSQ